MASTPPYFLNEFLQPTIREAPTEREHALGLTLSDLDWIHTLFGATDHARRSPQLRKHPMAVETFSINLADKTAIPLAGVFMMSPTPTGNKALLYTPYGGIEVFDNREALLRSVETRLKNTLQSVDIIQFLSIAQRQAFASSTAFTLTTAFIDGAVMEDQQSTIEADQLLNAQAMLEHLLNTPTLDQMLDNALASMAASFFAGLDHSNTRVESRGEPSEETAGWLGLMPLRDVLLQFYLKQAWPAGQTRTFSNPRHLTQGFDDAQRKEDVRRWESLVEQTAGVLANLLNDLLRDWWNEDSGGGESRLAFFAEVIAERFRADLLLKRQAGVITAEESYYARAIFVEEPQARCTLRPSLTINRLRIHAPAQQSVDLASTLLISDTQTFLYTQTRGLQPLKQIDGLNATLLSMFKAEGHEDELLNYLSIDERSLFLGMENAQISGVPVTGNVFEELLVDIVAKQSSNMEYALGVFRRTEGSVDLAALLDCALDVRTLLDSRLLELDNGGRWSPCPVRSDDGRLSTVRAERAKRELKALQAAETVLAEQRAKHPTLRRLVAQALNQRLQQQKLDADADRVYINTYSTAAKDLEDRVPLSSISMVDHFIARLATAGEPIGDTLRVGFYSAPQAGVAIRLNSLSSADFNRMVDSCMTPFAKHDIRTLPIKFLDENQEHLSAALLQGLRSEADMRLLDGTLGARTCSILDTVLSSDSMVRAKRHSFRGFLPDAYGLTLKVGKDEAVHGLANCFLLTERGGVDPLRSGQAVLWTPQRGHEVFESLHVLREALKQRLATPDERLALVQNLALQYRSPHQVVELGPLQRIDDHLLNNRQQSNVVSMLGGIDYWRSAPLGPHQLQDCLDNEIARMAPSNLDRAMAIARGIIQRQGLPAWLGMATPDEQIMHAELLEQYLNSAPDEQDYLHQVPSLREHVASRLRELLKKRFPELTLDPDDILIPTRLPLDGRAISLTDYALRHLPDLATTQIHPISRTTTALPPALDGTAVVQMIFQLDTANSYRTLLTNHLLSTSEDTRKRKALFCRQLPWQLLRFAHEEKLGQRLSAKAWSLVLQIFDMPDAVAREKVSGVTATIRPLELVATAGATPVKVQGVYLIGPKPPQLGPFVLYTPYRPQHVLQEYARESDVLDAINRPGPLQDWVIQLLDATHQAFYKNLWKSAPPGSATEITLAASPLRGNVLAQLFEDNAQQVVEMLNYQFNAHGKNQWETLTALLGEGIATAFRFLAGKLNFPRVVWNSFELFQTSAEHLQQQRWAEALKTFIQGVATMASLRKELEGLGMPARPQATDSLSTPGKATASTATTLDTLDVTQPLRTQLQSFESATVALDLLQESSVTGVYTTTPGDRNYVPVAGKVYPVTPEGERWRILQDEAQGPYVRLDAQSEWILDLADYQPRFGPACSRYDARAAERDEINIQASGMRAIAAVAPQKARRITAAINVATYYAVNCKRNLLAFARDRLPTSRVGTVLTELLGVLNLNPTQVGKIESCIDKVLGELVNPTFMRPDSKRFVVGTARFEPEHTYAFTIPGDREKKIYLLERFFDPWVAVYQQCLTEPFDVYSHARATVLLHEVAHLMCGAEDIAYMDSMRPFHDLIDLSTPDGHKLFNALSNVRQTALSVLTPAGQLFRTMNSDTGQWEDLGVTVLGYVRDHVLKVTGTTTLNDARHTFMTDPDKRMDVILTNADSVAYMIAELGRVLDPGA
ncbi:dermonecrotic toxin domain-containing protein [Pseudomonas trivialis]|uniref:Dermonecrotic toxin N-terminal domain-containing protein n=1 Tax=Pseudomonas trivialis TaxID=200450 RepID=A0A0H5A2B0_9PSED|nr:DUF6543 domain-containing protein [Pseudomonas trivialis]AKS04891.1 hypothetical protein AA957_01755 [Pseudomonas trivialis]